MSSQQEVEIQVVNTVIEVLPTDNNTKEIEQIEAKTEAVNTVITIPTEEVFRAYKYRFIILAVYSILSSVFGLLIAVSGPLLTTLQEIYNVDIFMVTLCMALVQYIVYVPSGFLANFILDKYGLRVGVLFGCFFLLIGTWVNVLSEHGFYILFIGNFISAIGQPFIFNAPQLVSSTWFLPQERALSTAIGSTSNLVGCGIGFMISPLFVHEDATGQDGLRQFHKLMQFCAYLASAAVLLNVVFFKTRPPTPPSKSSEAAKLTTCQSLKSISKNWNYIIFGVSASLTWGSVNFFGNMVQPMVYPFGISDTKAGTLSAITLGAGLVGSLLWASYVDKSRRFKCSILTCSILTIIFTVVMGAGLFTEKFALLCVATGFMGFFAMPILSLGFELCAELSYPAAEGTAGGLFSLTSNLVSVFGILASDAILKTETKAHAIYTLLLIVGIQVIGLIGFSFFKQDLRRSNAEKESKNDSKSTASNTSIEENKSDEEKKRFKELLSNSHFELPKEVLTPVVFRSVVSAHL